MRIGLDFGISFTDLVVEVDGKPTVLRHFPSDQQVSPQRVLELLQREQLRPDQLQCMAVTGGHSALLPDSIEGVRVCKVNEVNALGASADALLPHCQRPLLVVNSGTGTTCVLVTEEGCAHVGGNATGGGTLVGLARLTLDTVDPLEIEQLASAGRASTVDLSIADVVSNPIGSLPPDATAVNFGQLIRGDSQISRQDAAAGLANLIGQSVALTALTSALAAGTTRLCVVGRTPALKAVRSAMERVFALPQADIESHFPKLGPSASAIGALEYARTSGRRD